MPYEDVKEMLAEIPVFDVFGNHEIDKGLFIYTGQVLTFIKKDEIESMKSLRFS